MWLAIPMKIKKIARPVATAEAGGLDQEVRVDLIEDLSPGDYVIVHAGFAIQKMTEEEATENIRLLEDIKDAL